MDTEEQFRQLNQHLSRLEVKLASADATTQSRLSNIEKDIGEIKTEYVPLTRYTPVEKIVFGMCGLGLSALVLAVIGLVLTNGSGVGV